MENYKRIEIAEDGLLINKDYYKYLKEFKKPEKGLMTEKEYNYLLKVLERKAIKDLYKTKLVKWEHITEWLANGKKIEIKLKRCKLFLKTSPINSVEIVNSLEKHCYNKGQVIEKQDFINSKLALYLFYIIVFLICFILMKEMI